MTAKQVTQAIALVKAGKKEEARTLLLEVLKEDLHDETAWIWLAETMPDDEQRLATFERSLKSNPDSPAIHRALDKLRTRMARAPVPTSEATVKPLLQAIRNTSTLRPLPEKPSAEKAPPAPAAPAAKPEAKPKPKPAKAKVQPAPQPEKKPAPVAAPTVATPKPARPAPAPRPKKPFRWSAFDTSMVVLILLIGLGAIGYRVWMRYGASLIGQPFEATRAGLVATAGYLQTQNANLSSTLTAVSTQASSAQPSADLTPSKTAAATPAASLLPQPLYFIAGKLGSDPNAPQPGSNQIWRVELDAGLSQVTHETNPIEALAVSPLDGSLAYISNNQLILTAADGTNPHVLAGTPLASDQINSFSLRLSSPVWSPDGQHLAFGLNGVNVIDPAQGTPAVLIPNSVPPADQPQELKWYEPALWSPDGAHLLVRMHTQKCGAMLILPVAGGVPTPTFGKLDDTFAWTSDSQTLYEASPVPGGPCENSGGLWRIEAASGNITALVANPADATQLSLFGWPLPTLDGRLLFFYKEGQSVDLTGQTFMHSLYTSGLDGVTGRGPLGANAFVFFDAQQYQTDGAADLGSVLWASDGSLAVVLAARQVDGQREIWLVRTDGSPAVRLAPMDGSNLRWGVKH